MTLREKQSKFVKMVALLILYAYERGYELTFGDAWSKPEYGAHCKNSNHYIRLAIDLNLFKNGKWLDKTVDHEFLGEFWEQLHPNNRWGGRFEDGNHYSFLHLGRS